MNHQCAVGVQNENGSGSAGKIKESPELHFFFNSPLLTGRGSFFISSIFLQLGKALSYQVDSSPDYPQPSFSASATMSPIAACARWRTAKTRLDLHQIIH